jgi:hypothetical protein
MLRIPVILLGMGGALLLAPTCKAQEVNPDHFTDTGVQDVYDPGAAKVAPAVKQKSPALVARTDQTSTAVTLQLAAKRSPVLPSEPVAEMRKRALRAPKKPE